MSRESFRVGFFSATAFVCGVVATVLFIMLAVYWWDNDAMTFVQVFKAKLWLCLAMYITNSFTQVAWRKAKEEGQG